MNSERKVGVMLLIFITDTGIIYTRTYIYGLDYFFLLLIILSML